MAEKSDEQLQALRLRRALIGMAGSLAFVLLAWSARQVGLFALDATAFLLLFGTWIAGYALLIAALMTGWNRRRVDPSMTEAQIGWAAVGVVALYLLAPALAFACQLALVCIGLFGAFRLEPKRYLGINLLLAAGGGLGFGLGLVNASAPGSTAVATLGYAAFLVALVVVTVVGMEFNGFRRMLMQRNEQLTVAFECLRDMATRDELTGIPNRRFLMDVLQQLRAQHDRHPDQTFSICFVDIDHFKGVNDLFGHAKGDLVLKRFAEIAERSVREHDYVARYGGEEFVLVLVNTPGDQAPVVAERIRRQMAAFSISDERPDYRITASFGISEHVCLESLEHTIGRADAALYQAKRAGRDRVVVAPWPGAPGPSPDPVAAQAGSGTA